MLPERARALVLPAYQSSLVHFHGRRLWRVEHEQHAREQHPWAVGKSTTTLHTPVL